MSLPRTPKQRAIFKKVFPASTHSHLLIDERGGAYSHPHFDGDVRARVTSLADIGPDLFEISGKSIAAFTSATEFAAGEDYDARLSGFTTDGWRQRDEEANVERGRLLASLDLTDRTVRERMKAVSTCRDHSREAVPVLTGVRMPAVDDDVVEFAATDRYRLTIVTAQAEFGARDFTDVIVDGRLIDLAATVGEGWLDVYERFTTIRAHGLEAEIENLRGEHPDRSTYPSVENLFPKHDQEVASFPCAKSLLDAVQAVGGSHDAVSLDGDVQVWSEGEAVSVDSEYAKVDELTYVFSAKLLTDFLKPAKGQALTMKAPGGASLPSVHMGLHAKPVELAFDPDVRVLLMPQMRAGACDVPKDRAQQAQNLRHLAAQAPA